MPGGVKVARRPVKPFGVGASPTLAANFWKAGRYKLAAPVSKTGSVSTEVGALPTPSASLRQPRAGWRRLPTEASAKVGLNFHLRATAGRPFKPSTEGGICNDNHSSIRAEMAASEATKAHTAETSDPKQEEATASADSAEPVALNDLLPGRQSCGISSAVAPVIPSSGWQTGKGETNETGDPLPKPTASTAQLQTKSCDSNPGSQTAV